MSKTCPKCGRDKELTKFSQNKSKLDGLQCWCKKCCKKVATKWAADNPERKAKHAARWVKNNPEKNAKIHAESDRKHKAKYPEKIKARQAVYRAVRTGRLIKEPCHCGETNVQAHHEDYSKPLDVDWLCDRCHNKLRKKAKV